MIEIISIQFCVLRKRVHSRIAQYDRSVNTITLQRLIWLWSNFVHRTVLLISRSREEDENDWSTPSGVIPKNLIIPDDLFHGAPHKKKCLRIDRKVSYLVELEKLHMWEKNQPSISFLWEWYRSHNFSLKSSKFVKNKKNLQNLWAWVFSYYMVENEFQIYILVLHELTHSPTCFFLFCICMKKKVFGTQWWSLTEMIMLTISA
jgi:hypothetical protein